MNTDSSGFSVIDNYTLASPAQRIMAFAIDYLIALPIIKIPYLGIIVSTLYLVYRDSIPFLAHRSIGKRILKLRVIKRENTKISPLSSLKRNFIFIPNLLLLFNYEDFFFVIITLNGILFLLEAFLIYTTDDTQRMGDSFANTMVIEDSVV